MDSETKNEYLCQKQMSKVAQMVKISPNLVTLHLTTLTLKAGLHGQFQADDFALEQTICWR